MSQARRSGSQAPTVSIEPGAHAPAAGVATIRVHARNLAPGTRLLHVAVVGLDQGWLPAPAEVEAAADETVTVELAVTPAEGAVPGSYPFLVTIEATPTGSADGTVERTLTDATLRVDGASDLVLAVEPADSRGRRRKRIEVLVGNTGATPVEVALTSTADQELTVNLGSGRVELGPAETVRVPARVGPRRMRLVGSRTRHSYEVLATGQAAPRRTQATFTSGALLSAGAMRATAVVAVAAVWLAGVLVALPYVADRFSSDETPTSAETVTVDAESSGDSSGEGSSGTDSAAGDGDPNASGDAGGAGDSDGAGQEDGEETLRISGVITGAAPDDAAIEVVPTASLWPSSAAVGAGPQPGAAPGKMIVPAAPTAPVTPSGTAQRLTTFADGNGAWALAGLTAAARYLVTITKPGYSTQRVVMSGAELAATPLETDLQAGDGSMSGTVQGPDGPVGGAEITLTDGTTTITTRSATTGTVGSWQVEGLVTPSTYLVEASSPDLGTEAELIALPASGARTADLTLDAGVASVSGRVTGLNSLGQSSGLGGITVTATDGTTTRTATTLTGEGAGAFLLPRLPVGATYTMTIYGEGYTTVTREVRLTAEGVSGWTIPMTSAGGVVQGAVTDETGAGITTAGLTLTHGSDTTAVYKTMSASDGSGTFRFSGVDAGTYVLSAESFGHETSYAEVIVRPGGSVEVDLTLPTLVGDGLVATSSITGRITDFTTGAPITCPVLPPEECQVTAEVRAVDIDGQNHLLSTTVAPDADYTLPPDSDTVTGLLPGRYVVTITAPGYEPGEVEVTVPMATEVQAETVALVPSPSLTGSVQPRTGLLREGVCVIAQSVDESGAIEDPCGPDEAACETTTSRCVLVSDGTYRMDRLEAGRYEVSVTGLSDDYLGPEPELVTLTAGEVQRHDILVERLGIVSVSATRSDGSSRGPAEGAWVRAVQDGESGTEVVTEERVGETGSVQLTGLAPGSYTIAASEDQGGEALDRTDVTIGLNQELSIQLVLTSNEDMVNASVRYQREPAKDEPVPHASITIIGVASYLHGAPMPGTWTVETDANGTAEICADSDAGCEHTVPVLEDPWSIHVAAAGFEPVTLSNAPLSSLDRVILTPQAQEFTGSVTIAPDADGVVEGTRFEVLQAPPGVGDLSLQAGPDGNVTFSDTDAPESGQIRPGRYTIRATLDGYASSTEEFDVPLTITGPPPEPTWELLEDARVRVLATDDDTGAQVPGAVMTLRDPDGDLELERTAGPSQRVVDFGTLPAGDYEVDIRIAGYEHLESATITVDPGRTDPIEVPVTRLGTITGEVVTVLEDGWTQQLPGADVTVTPSDAADPTFTTSSGEDGGFAVTGTVDLEGLVDGEWNVSAGAEHHADASTEVTLSGGEQQQPGGEPISTVTLGLEPDPASLFVTVTNGTDLVESLDVVLMLSTPNGFRSITPCQEGTAECGTKDGTFHFVDLLPTSYTLFVSGSGYLPVSTPVTLEAGQPQQLQVPITAPTGSIQGQVLRTLPDGSTHPVDGGDGSLSVALVDDDGDRRYPVSGDGTYLIEGIEAGAYGVVVQEQSGGTWTDVAPVRTVSVLAGQSLALDLTIPLISRSVQLTLNSANGTDLTGALVTLTGTIEGEGEELTFGPQPVTRSGNHSYAVTFQQVPEGTWTATASGPAGHYGTHTSSNIEVAAGDGSDGTVTATMDIAETELRLQVAPVNAGPLTPPSRVTVTASPADTDSTAVETVTTTLITGASDTVIYLPAVGWNLNAAIEDGSDWDVGITPDAVGNGVASELARVSLNPPDITTTTTLDLSSEEVKIGENASATVAVVATDSSHPDPSTGTVELSWRRAGESDWTTLGGTVGLTAGTAVIDIDTTGWEADNYELRAVVTPPEGWATSSATAELVLTDTGSGSADAESDAGSGTDAAVDSDSGNGSGADADSESGAGGQTSADGP